FHSFCDTENIPRHKCLQRTEHLLCAFAVSCMGSLARNTMSNQMAALKAWHIYNNAPLLGRPHLCYMINGVTNLAPSTHKPSCPLVTCSMLLVLANSFHLFDPFDACCLAAASFTIWGQVHLGEILSPWERSFKPLLVIFWHHLHSPLNANGSWKCHLPFTKVAKSKGEDVVICQQWDSSDSISALLSHLSINQIPPKLPLFSYYTPHWDHWHCLTKKNLLTCCKKEII
ncbi:hypothetical protein J3R82DRAFT_10572, partial [Butyriboletus roseoflavus]